MKAAGYMLVDVICFGTLPLLVLVGSQSIPVIPYVSIALGFSVIGASFTVVRRLDLVKEVVFNHKYKKMMLYSGVLFVGAHVCLHTGFYVGKESLVTAIMFQTYSLFAMVISMIVGVSNEHLTKYKWILCGVAITGVVFVYEFDVLSIGMSEVVGGFLGLLSAVLLGSAVVVNMYFAQNFKVDYEDSLTAPVAATIACRISAFAISLFFLAGYLVQGNSLMFSYVQWINILFYGIVCLGFGAVAYYKALFLTDKNVSIHLLSYLSLVVSVVVISIFTGTKISQNVGIGVGLILVSSILINLTRHEVG